MQRPIYFILILLSLQSCYQERIELDYNVNEQKKLVISGWLNSLDEPQFVSIHFTANYLGAEIPEAISGAIVQLSDGQTIYDMEERSPGHYFLSDSWKSNVGANYILQVEYENQTYSASHQMRACPEIQNATYQLIEDADSLLMYETVFEFQEIEGEGDAYYVIDYLRGSAARDSIINGAYADDSFVDGQYFSDLVVTEYDRAFTKGDTAIIELHSIGLSTAQFLQDIEREIFRGSPFDPPPANVRTNIKGGAIGYFIVSDARQALVPIL